MESITEKCSRLLSDLKTAERYAERASVKPADIKVLLYFGLAYDQIERKKANRAAEELMREKIPVIDASRETGMNWIRTIKSFRRLMEKGLLESVADDYYQKELFCKLTEAGIRLYHDLASEL